MKINGEFTMSLLKWQKLAIPEWWFSNLCNHQGFFAKITRRFLKNFWSRVKNSRFIDMDIWCTKFHLMERMWKFQTISMIRDFFRMFWTLVAFLTKVISQMLIIHIYFIQMFVFTAFLKIKKWITVPIT